MNPDDDPPKWSDGASDGPAEIVRLLKNGRRSAPDSLGILRVGTRLRGSNPTLIPANWLPALAVATSLGGVAFAASLVHRSDPPSPPIAQAPVSTPVAQPNPAPSTALSLATDPPKVPLEPGLKTPGNKASPLRGQLPSEAELLRAGRRALSTDPKRTLTLMSQHRTRFSHGILAEERELLAQEALRALGRTEEATQKERQFQSRFEDSPYSPRSNTSASKPSDSKQ